MNQKKFSILTLAATALGFRLYGHMHGLSFHPDERHIIMVATDLRWTQLNPHSFAYGSLPFYLLWLMGQAMSLFDGWWDSYDGLFSLGRKLAVIIGTGTVIVTYCLGRSILKSNACAFVAALILATNPFHIQNSHFYTVDGLLTLLSCGCLLAIQRWREAPSRSRLAGIGVFWGLALSTKVASVTLALPIMLAVIDRTLVPPNNLFKQAWQVLTCKTFYLRLAAILPLAAFVSIITMPYALLDFKTFQANLAEQNNMVWGFGVPPYTIQYQATTPYLYHFQQMALFTVGPPLFALAVFGFLRTLSNSFKEKDYSFIFSFTWATAMFLSFAGLQVKFPRYMLPVYPILAISIGAAILPPHSFLKVKLQRLATYSLLAVSLVGLFYGLRFISIYRRDHTWVTASRWIYENIPSGQKLIGEHWDDKIPLHLPGSAPELYKPTAPWPELPVYEDDRPDKSLKWCETLANTDVIALPTARGYGSIPRQPHRFPWTLGHYRGLFSGKLGYELAASFKVRPSLFGIELRDELGDESLTVYDHPKALVFVNRAHKSADELCKTISMLEGPAYSEERQKWMLVEAKTP